MDRPDVFMPLYIGDYLAGTSRLTTQLHGAYMLLIMDYWMNGPPPDNDEVLASITKMSPDAWSNARALLEGFFSISEGCWKHKRVESELSAAYAKKRGAKEKAEKAAAARWGNAQKTSGQSGGNASSNATSINQALLKECPSPSPSHIYTPTTDVVGDEPKKEKRAKPAKSLDYSSWPSLPSEEVMNDWLALRKHLKAPVSQTVINAFGKELAKAKAFGYSADDCLRYAVVKSWRGFQFDWMQKGIAEQGGIPHHGHQGLAVATQPRQQQQSTRVRTLAEDLNDHSWAQ